MLFPPRLPTSHWVCYSSLSHAAPTVATHYPSLHSSGLSPHATNESYSIILWLIILYFYFFLFPKTSVVSCISLEATLFLL
ncbi:hypothetical protein BDV25DRAFT_150561 [Aspergillus avenaceus]|uniref:Uncharacterized protein n=1 Tax=Aspergillus avenaceus TaxID=36643 RepID=A0A5N6U270_ASPAV|nr:hypothetical protein BDV25DRAFT_150561 [Aspergillus avenaceus]